MNARLPRDPHNDRFGEAVFVLGLLARFFFQSCLGLADLLQPALASGQRFNSLVHCIDPPRNWLVGA